MTILIVVQAVKVFALLWCFASWLNTRLGGTQLQTPLSLALTLPEIGLLVLVSSAKEAFSFRNGAALLTSLNRLAFGLQQQGCRIMKRRVITSRKFLLVVKGLLLNLSSFATATSHTMHFHQGGGYMKALPQQGPPLPLWMCKIFSRYRATVDWKDYWTAGAVATAALGAVMYYFLYPNEFNEDRDTRRRLQEYMQEQGPDDVSEVGRVVPPVYRDQQDYSRNHRRDPDDEDGLPVLDPAILRRLEDESIIKHRALCGEQDPDYQNGEVKLFGESGFINRNITAVIMALTTATAVFTKVKPKHAIVAFAGLTGLVNFALATDPSKERAQRSLVRRRRKVARKLKTCLYIREYVRTRLTPESLRVKTREDGEMCIDGATSCLVDRMLQEYFKLHCWNLQSIAEYQDLARVVVFYTNDDLGIARALEPRLGQPLTR